MDLGLHGRVAAVAASSRGLGKASAVSLARDGAHVVICARGEEHLAKARSEVAAAAGDDTRVHALRLDVVAEPEALVAATVERFGALHVLVANAGGPPPGNALDHDDEAYRAAIDANCMASIRMARAAVEPMRAAGWGRICFIASMTVKSPAPGMALSNTARAALAAFSKTLAGEVARDGITVNLALPGTHDTERIRELGGGRFTADSIPVGRLGRPEDFGDVVAFLCSEPASFVTGTSVLVDGGAFQGLL
ncbi:MAG TPA: SDR family oxidoreductase [Acidimicrobiia bacterium]|nr:SDR family oxidoreductase [Acidimicrobiia bacterium]